jgi:serine/threonine-protein kinase HipA
MTKGTSKELAALADGREIGLVRQGRDGKLSFTYSDEWRSSPAAFPLSLSMPPAIAEHGHAKIDPFLRGLLPDSERILDQWGRRFHVSSRNAFALISHVGEDCAGAVQFVPPDRVSALRRQSPADVQWLDEATIAQRLRSLRADHAAWRLPRDTGQFSLAGAQPKTALLFLNGRWGLPSGRVPTTHILKPPTGEFDGHAENEHFCLELARALGMAVPNSAIMYFEDEIAIVVERYDRIATGARLLRVHQEDTCQALALPPTRKYQSEGGPGVAAIFDLLQTTSSNSEEDTRSFLDSVAYNWIIAGTDAHAKNYAVLLAAGGQVRLAPLYDLASVLPYSDFDPHRIELAMKLGGEYRLLSIGLRQWQKLAKEVLLDPDEVIHRVVAIADAIPDRVAEVSRKLKKEGLTHAILPRLEKQLIARASQCRKLFPAVRA